MTSTYVPLFKCLCINVCVYTHCFLSAVLSPDKRLAIAPTCFCDYSINYLPVSGAIFFWGTLSMFAFSDWLHFIHTFMYESISLLSLVLLARMNNRIVFEQLSFTKIV